jgi:O-acetylhomoserine (thiol)-lyase
VAVFEERMASLEDGVGAIATASGQAALHLAIVTLMGRGGHIVASASLYGGSHNLLHYTLPRFGVETTFVPARDLDAWARAIRPETRLAFRRIGRNPSVDVLGRARGFRARATAQDPATRRRDGDHSRARASLRAGRAPCRALRNEISFRPWRRDRRRARGWRAHGLGGFGKFPTLTEPYDGFHGMNFAEESTTSAFLLRARREGLRDFGACMAPMTAFQILQGLETLPLRMARHIANTRRIVEFLSIQKEVEGIHHPDEPNHPDHQLAARLYPRGAAQSFPSRSGAAAKRAASSSSR